MMDSLSCSRADAASRKASTLTKEDTKEASFLNRHALIAGGSVLKNLDGCSVRSYIGARTPAACCFNLPHFQLIQTFQELPGAISHRQGPAELGVEGFVDFGLYFGLSHGGERRWRLRGSFWVRVETTTHGSARLTVLDSSWEGISKHGPRLPSLAPLRRVPGRRAAAAKLRCGGPRGCADARSDVEKQFWCDQQML